jgi:Domain of unknown function (DUF4360)
MKFAFLTLALTFWCALTTAAPTPAPDEEGPDWSKVTIKGITYAGSGCKAGSVAITPTSDWQTVTLAFDSYVASIGPNEKLTDRRKNCNININLYYPPGYSYTLYKTDYFGRAELEAKVTARQSSTYWFAGFVSQKATLKTNFDGPYSDTYSLSDTLGNDVRVWSPCGASTTLNIDTELLLNNDKDTTKSGFITTDVIDHSVKTKKTKHLYGIKWKKCK